MYFIKVVDELKVILTHELKGIRQSEITKLSNKYRKELDIIFSLTLETKRLSIKTKYNSVNHFDFQSVFGEILYHYINDDKTKLINYIQKIHYNIQTLFYFIFTKYLIKKLGKDYLLQNIETYYSLNDIITMVELPDTINKEDLPIQALSLVKKTSITFPLYYAKINSLKKWRIFYLIKNNGKTISNITSYKLRVELNNILPNTAGVIGVFGVDKKYKRKMKAYITYYNNDFKNVKDIYIGKGKYDNQLESFSYLFAKSDLIHTIKTIKVDNKDTFISFLKKYKHKSRDILFDNNSLIIFKPKISYQTAKIIDYIYNDNFDIVGLVVDYQNKKYDIYFNVNKTDYIYGIYNRFVKIAILSYMDIVLSVRFNSVISKWHYKFDNCIICKDVKFKHRNNGICSSCYNKLNNISKQLSGNLTIDKDIEDDFVMVLNNVEIYGKGNKITFNPLSGYQLNLGLEKITSL